MRVSANLLIAAVSASGAFAYMLETYKWSITDWSGGVYGIAWANYEASGPALTGNNVAIPAFSLTPRCELAGSEGTTLDCSHLIENNTNGKTFKVVMVHVSTLNVVSYATYTFKSVDR
ncbi:uncharacterized protein ColSpa_09418 [Colletotrichum spaethianum]|uniref:Uncharacterized protein n=1 Tax=Colletotrichum spaethianum TaxID=700344 RepID=A0AA37PBM5_9PEZI|nr:uncharacterized protein ColSpa_09418 [Colletotrichum spaethianum]GKT49237.1 hypothetical protein ColSpa_09418 [Colletotrichum spaethianum]